MADPASYPAADDYRFPCNTGEVYTEAELIALREFMAPECEVYLYCSCAHEATSVRVAYMLEQADCKTKVIQGGLKAWVKAGEPATWPKD